MSGPPDGWEIAGGVMWCVLHHGVADECSSDGERCDMADEGDECDLRDLAYAPAEFTS